MDPAVLAAAVTKVEEVNLEDTELTTQQITYILVQVLEDINLKKLFLGENNIADVDFDVIRNARERLGDGLHLEPELE